MFTLRLQRSGCSAGSVIKRVQVCIVTSQHRTTSHTCPGYCCCSAHHRNHPWSVPLSGATFSIEISRICSVFRDWRHWLLTAKPECVLYVNCKWVRGHVFTVPIWHHLKLAAVLGSGPGKVSILGFKIFKHQNSLSAHIVPLSKLSK